MQFPGKKPFFECVIELFAKPSGSPTLPWSRRAGSLPVALLMFVICGILVLVALNRPVRNELPSERLAELADQMRVNVNQASVYELQVIPGIGPALAQKIVAERSASGDFAIPADLERVSGIGPRTIEKIIRYLVITPAPEQDVEIEPGEN